MEEESKTGWSNTKKLIVSILILLVFFGGALVIGFMISGDIQEVDDRDLMVPEIVVADEDNAYFNLEKALSLYIEQQLMCFDRDFFRKLIQALFSSTTNDQIVSFFC